MSTASTVAQTYAPMPIKTQVQAIYESDIAANCVALVWPEELESTEFINEVKGTPTRFVYCPSELAMREALVKFSSSSERLVLVSKYNEVQLAKDVLARLWKQSPQQISPWKNLQQFIKVREIDPRLKKNGGWIAKALLGRLGSFQRKVGFGEVLDQENAWKALALAYLNYSDPTLDLQSLFSWSVGNGAAALVEQLPEDLKENLDDWLKLGLPKSSALVKSLLLDGQADDLLPIGLACSIMYYPGVEQQSMIDTTQLHISRGVFKERFLAGETFEQGLLQQFGIEAVDSVTLLLHQQGFQAMDSVLGKAEQILASLDLTPVIGLSTVLPASLQKRLSRYAHALSGFLAGGDAGLAEAALVEVKQHVLAGFSSQQETMQRAEMAIRLARWLQQAPESSVDAVAAISEYIEQGSFADWARSVVWAGDVHEDLSKIYHQLTEQVGDKREAQNKAFAEHMASIARGDTLPDNFIPVESALEKLIAPIAKENPVLLLVLDGMSEAVYRELNEDLVKHHWLELRAESNQADPCLVAALPSVTQVSRCSLLSGVLQEGSAPEEKKAFAAYPELKKLASPKFPPTVYHKSDLIQSGSGALNSDVRAKLASTEYRILGVVINAIDDQLSSSSQISFGWTLDNITLLRQVLEAARDAGRVVVITSDHGHVLDHNSFYQQPLSDNGERYQLAAADPSEYEVAVYGDRVVTADKSVTMPWTERLRYTKSKNMGYHGGASLQELVIPLGVFVSSAHVEALPGWTEVPRHLPEWWHAQSFVNENQSSYITPAQAEVAGSTKAKKSKKAAAAAEVMDDMFASPVDAPTTNPDQGAGWVDSLFVSTVYQQIKARAGRTAVKEEQLRALITLLEQQQGQAMEAAVLRHLGIPKLRLRGFLAGAQKLLNVDGYPILTVDRESQTIKLSVSELKNQFEI
ncbi:BREX-2 system phosphatase PglZ [Microbulbifer sp. ZKSA004]|uniref:BREX-2 system phosphatase PglZ n=1 Tax=Microbulbifer sp. ZKSA004 TaxID=3243389 RepID=UPI004039E35E